MKRTMLQWLRWSRTGGLVTMTVVSVLVAGPAAASPQEQDQQSYENVETEAQASMRNDIYQELAVAQEKAEAKQYAEAIAVLNELREDEELNPYELAQAWNLYAYVYYAQDNYPKAIDAYQKLLSQPDLPSALETSTLYTLSQLYFATEKWPEAISTIKRWIAAGQEPTSQTYEMLAQAYYQAQDYRNALEPTRQAIDLKLKEGQQPSENLYLLLRVLYYQLKDYRNVEEILEELIERYPKRQYWMQLISIYGEMEDEKKQLQTLELAYLQGFLETETQLMTLAGLLLKNDLPWEAGTVIEKGLADKIITETEQHWRLLAQAWTLAQEHEKAIPALTKAAGLSSDGELNIILAQTYMNLDRWQEAAQAIRDGLRKGGLLRPDQAQIMLGQALFNEGDLEGARQAFESAQADPRSGQLASQWLQYVENEIDRKAQLADALD